MSEPVNESTVETVPAGATLPEPRKDSTWRRYLHWPTLLLAAVVLLCGMVIGSAGAAAIIRNRIVAAVQHPEQSASRAASRLQRQLDLSDNQTQQVERILAERTRAFGDIYRDNLPRIAHEIALTKQQIAEILTSEQRQEWLERISRLERLAKVPSSP